jgi:quinol monooxygenase YgiN
MSEPVHVFATVCAQAGKEAEIQAVLSELAAESVKEPGVVHYMVHVDPKNPANFYVFEIYKDQAAADSHMKSPHLAAAFAKAGPLVASAPSIVETKLVAGK